MRTIPIGHGYETLVDDEWFLILSQWKWRVLHTKSGTKYARRTAWNKQLKKYEMLFMHRVVLGLQKGDARVADHINRNGLDNRVSNLRVATPQLNTAAAKRRSKFRGAYFHKNGWQASITINGESRYLGRFKTGEEANNAYAQAAMSAWGEFARVTNE